MNLSCTYLGLKLGTPLIIGASPFADDVHTARELEDMGAAAIVMRSLFEEQIYLDELSRAPVSQKLPKSGDTADPYYPPLSEYQLSPDQYLRQITQLKSALGIPIIASLNGCRPGGWIDYARRFETAGADAVELNLYQIATDSGASASEIEADMIETVRLLRASVKIPVAVKLQPFHTSLANFAAALQGAGADGIVVFNRFYQSEFDLDEQTTEPRLRLSDSTELLLRLRWTAILSAQRRCSIAVTGGVHGTKDVVKAILAGASAVQLVSAVLQQGPRYLTTLVEGLERWMDQKGYRSIDQFHGALNLDRCPDAAAFERGSYQRILQSWRI